MDRLVGGRQTNEEVPRAGLTPRVTLVDLRDAALLQRSRRAVDLGVDHTLGAVQADGERRRLVHLEARLLLDNTHSHAERSHTQTSDHHTSDTQLLTNTQLKQDRGRGQRCLPDGR